MRQKLQHIILYSRYPLRHVRGQRIRLQAEFTGDPGSIFLIFRTIDRACAVDQHSAAF